jgi:hypothetical protein
MKKPQIELKTNFTDQEKIAKFNQLQALFKEYINFCNNEDYFDDNDWEHYIYEEVCEVMHPSFFKELRKIQECDDE